MSILKTIMTLVAPEAAVPADILANILKWRPSLSEIVIFLLVIFCLVQTFRIEGIHIKPHLGSVGFTLVDVDGYRENVADLKGQLATKTALESQAHEAQVNENQTPYVTSQAIAENINDQSSNVDSRIAAAVQAYADANPITDCSSLRRAPASGVHTGTTSLREPNSTTTSGNQTNVDAIMVSIPSADLGHYVQNTSDLLELRTYLKRLIDNGDAVPYTDAQAPVVTATSASSAPPTTKISMNLYKVQHTQWNLWPTLHAIPTPN